MRVLVTGGTGFIGRNIVQRLMAEHEVLITGSEAEPKIPGYKGLILQPSFVGLDFERIGHVDVLLHQAAINDTTNLDSREVMRANLESSRLLIEHVAKHGCKRIVFASSTAVYGDGPAPYHEEQQLRPLNPYAESKLELERFAMAIAHSRGLIVVGLRYCNVYGPGEAAKGPRATMVWQLARQMSRGDPTLFEFGEQKRDLIYVKDVVQANILAMEAVESCIVNCGAGQATTFNELVCMLNTRLGTQRKPRYIKNPYGSRYQSYTECDMSQAKEKLGFVPVFDVQKGIDDYTKNGLLENLK